MPAPNLHMTALEVTHSLTVSEINELVNKLLPSSKQIADYPSTPSHQARLIKPMLSYDAAALALSFVPAAGEVLSPTPTTTTSASASSSTEETAKASSQRTLSDDTFTYHHLRRDLYTLTSASISVGSRYVVPSAHLTIARFNSPNPFASSSDPSSDPLDATAGLTIDARRHWIHEIEAINKWLETEYWPTGTSTQIRAGGEWIIGDEKGLDLRRGTLWYGGGESIYQGKAREV